MSGERIDPRVSVNKLGEYLVAGAVRRRRIVTDQKRPNDFIVSRYREAGGAIVSFLERGALDDSIIERAIQELLVKPVCSDFQEQDRDLSIEALECFLDMADSISLDGLRCFRGDSEPPHMSIAGVSISVRPDVIVAGTSRNGESTVGLLKLYLVKTFPLTDAAGSFVGAILQQHASTHFASHGSVDFRLCQTLDVFAKRVHVAPRSFRRRQTEIEAACEEYARAWASV